MISFKQYLEGVRGIDTSWEDGDVKVNIQQILNYLDSNNTPIQKFLS